MEDQWHRSKITVVSIIFGIAITIGSVIWQGALITAGIDTMSATVKVLVTNDLARQNDIIALRERVLRNEIMLSEQGKLLTDIKRTLEKFDTTLDRINVEQQRRTSTIERSDEHLNGHMHNGE